MATQLTKYLQRRFDNRRYPTLLVFKDKHSNSYYLCKDQEAIGRACLEMLKIRLDKDYGYIRHPGPEDKIYGLKKDVLTKEAAEALPEPYKTSALKDIAHNDRLRREWAEELENYATAKKALKEKDGNLAYMVLDARRDYEYEGFNFEDLIVP